LCFLATIFSCKASSGYLSHLICFACEVLAWVSLITRENKGTERDSEGVGWDMSIPQRLFIDWLLNGSLFPETSA